MGVAWAKGSNCAGAPDGARDVVRVCLLALSVASPGCLLLGRSAGTRRGSLITAPHPPIALSRAEEPEAHGKLLTCWRTRRGHEAAGITTPRPAPAQARLKAPRSERLLLFAPSRRPARQPSAVSLLLLHSPLSVLLVPDPDPTAPTPHFPTPRLPARPREREREQGLHTASRIRKQQPSSISGDSP